MCDQAKPFTEEEIEARIKQADADPHGETARWLATLDKYRDDDHELFKSQMDQARAEISRRVRDMAELGGIVMDYRARLADVGIEVPGLPGPEPVKQEPKKPDIRLVED